MFPFTPWLNNVCIICMLHTDKHVALLLYEMGTIQLSIWKQIGL